VTVLSRQAVWACLVAGPALWLSRAVFDRVGQGAGTRVAFLRSWPELIGLVVLVALTMLVVEAIANRLARRTSASRSIPPGVFAPLFILPCLALPYLPWLADAVPAVDALAGPGRWWVWAVVFGQIAWQLVALAAERRAEVPLPATRGAMLVALASAAVFLGSAWRLVPGPVYPGGDEPHYLIVTQSLLSDHDLAIENNHARGDYRAYYAGPLKPDYRVTGVNRTIYSIHPVGISAIIAPAFALDGYRGAIVFVALVAALSVTILWSWLLQLTGSVGAATVGWLAVATSAPFVLHSFSIYPECAAALAVMIAVGWRWRDDSWTSLVFRGAALGSLPWLSTKYAPMSGVLVLLIAARTWQTRSIRRRAAVMGPLMLIAPYAVSCAAWLAWFWWMWGTPSPTAPYGASHQMSLESLKAGLPGLFADQEYGAFAAAPALALAVIGWWRLFHRDLEGKWLVALTALPLVALALVTGAFALWWGGSAPPGRELVAALPLLGVPIAWLWRDTADRPAQRAAIEALVLVGIAVTATFVVARNGLLIANGRDGGAELLEFLEPRRALTALMPSFIAFRSEVGTPLAVVAVWTGVAAAAWWLCRRVVHTTPGGARLAASAIGLGAVGLAAMLVPVIAGSPSIPPLPVEARVEAPSLTAYDATARPIAIEFNPWRVMTPGDAIRAIRFDATPGLRRSSQPVRVLLNTRLALPAGMYRVRVDPIAGEPLTGNVALQVGRTGPPSIVWPLDVPAGGSWTEMFTIDVDANFVGFRTTEDVERRVGRLEVTPIEVVGRGDRMRRPAVLASARYGSVPVYFHDDRTYPEQDGFWVRGRTTTELTLGLAVGAQPPGIRLQLHGGASSTPVDLATPAWSTRVVLTPGKTEDVHVPARDGQALLALSVTPESGFVPAEHGGAASDRRLLGCWITIVP
jgi:hypothetical protein